MRKSDWLLLAVISLVVSLCGVIGVSYVSGKGEPTLDTGQVAVFTALFTIVAGAVFLLMDKLFAWVCCTRATDPIPVVSDSTAAIPLQPMIRMVPRDCGGIGIYSYGPKDSREHYPIWDLARVLCYPEEIPIEELQLPPESQPVVSPNAPSRPTFLGRITPRWSPASIIICCVVMAIFWAPWLIANFPGGTYWDTYYQIYQIYPENHPIAIIPWAEIYDQTLTDAWLVDHHPVLTTLLYGAFGWISDQLTGNWMAGVFLYCLLQGIAHIIAFTCAIAYLRKRGCPIVLCFCAYIFLCIMPFISTWAMCMVKDSLFGVLCVPYFIMLFEAVRTHGASLARTRSIVLFVVLGLLLCLTRKMGVFMVVPTALILWLALRRTPGLGKACGIQAATCVLVVGLLLPYVVFPLAQIAPGGAQETFGPLFQQTARYLRDYGDEISVQEKRAISAILDYEKLANQYQYDFADSVKYRYNLNATPEQLLDYLSAYLTMGARHPDSYLAAFASLAGFYVAPTAYANIRMVTVDTRMGDDDRYMLWNPPALDELRTTLDEAYTAVATTPGLDIPLLIVTYAFWLPAGLIFTCIRRRMRCGTLLAPALILLAFVLISPVYDARYCVPIFDLAPLLVCAFGAIGATMYADYVGRMDWAIHSQS